MRFCPSRLHILKPSSENFPIVYRTNQTGLFSLSMSSPPPPKSPFTIAGAAIPLPHPPKIYRHPAGNKRNYNKCLNWLSHYCPADQEQTDTAKHNRRRDPCLVWP